jgi:PAS domain S-box-containing protein
MAKSPKEWAWEADTDGVYTYASPRVEKILGYKPEEIVGKKRFYDLFHPEDKAILMEGAFEAFAKKEPFDGFINRNIHKNGKTVWLSTRGIPMLDSGGNLIGYRGVDTDITEHKERKKS